MLGSVLGAIGPLLVVWNLFIDTEPGSIALRLLSFGAGYALASFDAVAGALGRRLPLVCTLLAIGWVALMYAAIPGLAVIGFSAALLLDILVRRGRLEQRSRRQECALRIGAVAGVLAVLVGYSWDSPAGAPLVLTAFPVALLVILLRRRELGIPAAYKPRRSPQRLLAGTMVASLVFIESGCEWGFAFWIPLYSIRTLGTSPASAICVEALFLGVLLAARLLSQRVLLGFERRRVLIGAFILSMSGYLVLRGDSTLLQACTALVLLAAGLAPVYTVTSNVLDERFAFEPVLYRRLFLDGIAGAVVFACAMAYVDGLLGLRALPLLPLLGSSAVAVLQLLLMFEKRLMGSDVSAV